MPPVDHHNFHQWHIRLLMVSWAELKPERWRFHLRGLWWRMYVHDRDGAVMESDGVRQPLHAGRVYLIPADTMISGSTTRDVGQFFCHFQLLGLPAFALRVLFPPLMELPITAEISGLVAEAMTLARKATLPMSMAQECRVKALLYSVIGSAIDALSPERIDRSRHMHANLQPVLPALAYIDQHLEEHITLEMLADACALTPVYFGRRFHQCTGMTPINYLQEARVKASMQRLAFTDLSIEQIALHTGFGSRAYFSRIFARHIGQSPAAYRKALRT